MLLDEAGFPLGTVSGCGNVRTSPGEEVALPSQRLDFAGRASTVRVTIDFDPADDWWEGGIGPRRSLLDRPLRSFSDGRGAAIEEI